MRYIIAQHIDQAWTILPTESRQDDYQKACDVANAASLLTVDNKTMLVTAIFQDDQVKLDRSKQHVITDLRDSTQKPRPLAVFVSGKGFTNPLER